MTRKKTFQIALIACAAIVLTAIVVAVVKQFYNPIKNKLLGVEIGSAGLRYVYGDYIYNPKTGKKLLTDICWIHEASNDSIGIVAKEGKRAFINLNTAELITPLEYDKAWEFSCDRGVMVRSDTVFIFRRDGSIVNPEGHPYEKEYSLVFFHNNLILHGDEDNVGLIDTAANWVLQPEYKSINIDYSHRLYNTEKKELWQVFDFELQPVLQGPYKTVSIDWSEGIIATEHNGIDHLFSYQGKLIYEVIYRGIRELIYEETSKDGKQVTKVPTNCYLYEAYNGKCGLMNRHYKILTPPQFYNIEAQTPHVFFASFGEYGSRFGTLIDELGRPLR